MIEFTMIALLGIVLINLGILGINVKLYTEIVKRDVLKGNR